MSRAPKILPVGLQLKRLRGWRLPDNTVSVGRPSLFGNPFPLHPYGRTEAVRLHTEWITSGKLPDDEGWMNQAKVMEEKRSTVLKAMPFLRGKNLACWCKPPTPYQVDEDCCHRAILLKLANK